MIFMMMVIVAVLVAKVLPIFEQVFAQLGTGMSGFSQSLLNLGNLLNKYSFALVIVLVIVAIIFLYFALTSSGKKNFKKF